MTYKLIERFSHRSFATGFRGPVEQIKLTDEGRQFIPKMFKKFNVEEDAGPGCSTLSSGSDRFGEFEGIPTTTPSRLAQGDEAELQA